MLLAGALLATAALAGCGTTVVVEAAPSATDPACAQVLAALTGADELAGRERHEVSAQAAAAWGDPPVVMRCGVEPPGPSTDGCVEAGGVDWVSRVDEATGGAVYTTYGRVPAVEVRVPEATARGLDAVLGELAGAVADLEQTRRCY
ncbi:DUF3515 family protein [Thalassiella azotivora]